MNDRAASFPDTSMAALILAGGKGSRLMDLTNGDSKPYVCFGGSYRFIDFSLSNAVNSQINHIAILTQYKAHGLIAYVMNGWSRAFGTMSRRLDIWPASQTLDHNWYKGTADAVYQNIAFLRQYEAPYTLVLSGDHIYKMDYRKLLADHLKRDGQLTIASLTVPIETAQRFGVMTTLQNGQVVAFNEKPTNPLSLPHDPSKALINMGVYLFNTAFLIRILEEDARDRTSSHDFGRDILPKLATNRQLKIYTHDFKNSLPAGEKFYKGLPYWQDIGTIDAYWQTSMDFLENPAPLNLKNARWPIYHFSGGINQSCQTFEIGTERETVLKNSLISNGCHIQGGFLEKTLLCPNVTVAAKAVIKNSILLENCTIGAGASIQNAIVEKNCRIPKNMSIGTNTDQESSFFYISPKGIRLVTQKNVEAYEQRLAAAAKTPKKPSAKKLSDSSKPLRFIQSPAYDETKKNPLFDP